MTMTVIETESLNALEIIAHARIRQGKLTVPLPSWSGFLAKLAAFTLTAATERVRPVVTVSLPSRAYAGVFAALGAVLARNSGATVTDSEYHFDRLSSLNVGARVTYINGED